MPHRILIADDSDAIRDVLSEALQDEGYDVSEVASGDAVIEARTIERLENGAVILLHDGSPDTLRVLDDILTRTAEDGLTTVSPHQMLSEVEGLGSPR